MDADNCCEHGDHAAPPGQRFCSPACEECEHATGGIGTLATCAGICDIRFLSPAAQMSAMAPTLPAKQGGLDGEVRRREVLVLRGSDDAQGRSLWPVRDLMHANEAGRHVPGP